MSTRPLFILAALLAAPPALAKDTSYLGSVEAVGRAAEGAPARGTVFADANRNSRLDAGEAGVPGVTVSNGREVAVTGEDGRYELPAYEDMNLFVTKPAGYATPVDDDMIPQFAYVHKIAGSPDLRFGGIAPTGPLPAEVNFPLVEDDSDRAGFECLAFGDTQPYSNKEIGYVRATAGDMLANRDMSDAECLIFEGDVMGDDLSLFPRFKRIVAVGDTPVYFVAGNHDLDFDAESDQHSFDTFRREWGPEYYAFEVGNVHFVVLDNVRYPCNGVDDHPFCAADADPTYNGVITQRQLDWLEAALENVPEDKLIVLNQHIPLQTFTDAAAAKHQTDNFADLAAIVGDRPALALAGHTHTTESLLPGVSYEGWEENTGLAEAPFHQIVTGAVSGSWWAGDLNDQGVPHATQRLGAPRGYYQIAFDGADYVDTFHAFGESEDTQLHASFNTPRFRDWAEKIISYADLYGVSDVLPPVTRNDLGDMYMLTAGDLAEGTWVAVNVWNGSQGSEVRVRIDDGESMAGTLTQPGEGEAKNRGPEFADPLALARQSTQSDMAVRSAQGGDDTAGYRTWQGTEWAGAPGPFQRWMLTDNSAHLWRVDLPESLPEGLHTLTVETTDRHGRTHARDYPFEVVDELPDPNWQAALFEDE